MKPPKLSIAGLLMLTAVVALGLAALSRPSCLWASVMFSLLLLSLSIALIGVVYHRGTSRAFWTGFLTCGSLYAVLSSAPWFDSHIAPRLITTAVLDLLYPAVPLLPSTSNVVNDPWKLWTGSPPDYYYAQTRAGFSTFGFNVNTTGEFVLIGHSLFGMLVASCGGVLARQFHEDGASPEV